MDATIISLAGEKDQQGLYEVLQKLTRDEVGISYIVIKGMTISVYCFFSVYKIYHTKSDILEKLKANYPK